MTLTSDPSKLIRFYQSPIGKKIITGVTGLGLTFFVFFHMTANLVLFTSIPAYNQLAHSINSLGILIYFIEFILLGLVIFHAAITINIRLNSQQARPIGYDQLKTAGQPSKQSLSSRTMLMTGLILLIFLIFHVATFKFGAYYATMINGVEMRDLARLVIEKFQDPIYTFSYLAVMVLLGLHLRHGIWSALQSVGAMNAVVSPLIYAIALFLAILIAIGFLVLPLTIYFGYVG
jgi:succinate dehydrogenase / fumarate reductase cytochrome b subunit